MFFHSGVIIAPSSNYKAANYVKDENPTLEKVPSNHKVANPVKNKNDKSKLEKVPRKTITTKRRFSARLRKIRWVIYNTTPSKRNKITRTLKHYKKLVKQFLDEFSSKLKPKEISIWKDKVAKTVEDVKKSRGKSQDTMEVNKVNTCKCSLLSYTSSI